MEGSTAIQLYSRLAEKACVLQTVHNDFEEKSIPLAYASTQAAELQISIPDSESFVGVDLLLKDLYMGAVHHFNDGAYSFEAEGENQIVEDRFELLIQKTQLSVEDIALQEQLHIEGGDFIKVHADKEVQIENIRLYDISGSFVKEWSVQSNVFEWANDLPNAIYLIEVNTSDDSFNKKIILE
jgi:hypothetical protein